MCVATVFRSILIVVWHVCREGDELSRCISVYLVGVRKVCSWGEQKGWRSRFCWWAKNARVCKCL